MTENNNRVCCLYRVSTDKQVDFNSNHEADLPMQRKACHKSQKSRLLQNAMKKKTQNARIICKTFRHSGTRQKKTCWH